MFRFRHVILGVGAALALGTGSALAMQADLSANNADSHGDTVASAARTTCPAGEGHGACVSAIASTEGQENKDGARAAAVAACKAADASEDATEKSTGATEDSSEKATTTTKAADRSEDKSERSADRTEDRAEKQQLKACLGSSTTSA